jgi:hypothetical protein
VKVLSKWLEDDGLWKTAEPRQSERDLVAGGKVAITFMACSSRIVMALNDH